MSDSETSPKKRPPPPGKNTTIESSATEASDTGARSRSRSQSRRARRRKQTTQPKKHTQMPALDEEGEADEDEGGAMVRYISCSVQW